MIKQIGSFIIGSIFLLLAFAYHERYQQNFTEVHQALVINENIDRITRDLEGEVDQVLLNDFKELDKCPFPIFLVDSSGVVRWNSFEFLPDLRLMDEFEWKFFQNQRGMFLLFKKQINSHSYLLSYIPLYTKYSIANKYLTTQWNEAIVGYTGVQLSSNGEGVPVQINGKTIFTVTIQQPLQGIPTDGSAISLLIVSLLFFGFGIFVFLNGLQKDKRVGSVLFYLIVLVVSIRVAMLLANLPQRWVRSSLFDPQVFASSGYNASVGDLFLNTIIVLICCTYLFLNYTRFGFIQRLSNVSESKRVIIASLLLLVCYFSFLFPFLFIETIFHNSSISLDITQSLQLDAVRIVAWTSVILGTIAAFFIIHVSFRVAVTLVGQQAGKFLMALTVAIILFLGYALIMDRNYWITLITCFVFLCSLFYSKQFSLTSASNTKVFFYVTLTLAAFSIQAALATQRFTEEKRIESQFRFGRNFLISRDVLGEYLLDQASRRISNDPFIQSRLATPFLNQEVVRNKIKQVDLSGYFDRYEVKIHLFSSAGKRTDSEWIPDLAAAIKDFQINSSKTDYPGIYLIQPTAQYIRKYVALVPVDRSGIRVGYVALELFLKKVIPHSVYPELLLDNRFSQFFSKENFSYAFYRDTVVELNFGKFNYTASQIVNELDNPSLFTKGLSLEDGLHAAIEDEYGRVVVVSSETYPLFFLVTNFSFYFIVSLALVLLALLIYNALRYRANLQITYSLKIQLYIYTAFVLPLIAVTFAVLTSMSNYSEQEIKDEFETRSRLYADQVSVFLAAAKNDSISYSEALREQLAEFTRVISLDATVYNSAGIVLASTQPLIFENALVSNLINPRVLQEIIKEGESSVITDERIGKLDFSNAYSSLRDPFTGEVIGILSLPFFDSLASYERTKINTLSLMLTIFVFIFILFSILSAYAVSWLTFPLHYITKTLRATTFSGRNAKMEWKGDDEIGLMVREYNRMVENLEQNKIDLARTQKERAWREMAQQVAHEIKNPLTPMKLTLQQLQMAVYKDQLDTEKLKGSLDSLLGQVEILNDIASSFNSFARMPAPELHPLELNDLLEKSIALYANDEITISYKKLPNAISIWGDSPLLTRVFSNLILNAKQSVRSGKKATLTIETTLGTEFCCVSFTDNGEGIEEGIRDKVFIPHFSTKKSGSGLGLAIAKQGIEQSGGAIWFETSSSGTTFYINLLLVKP